MSFLKSSIFADSTTSLASTGADLGSGLTSRESLLYDEFLKILHAAQAQETAFGMVEAVYRAYTARQRIELLEENAAPEKIQAIVQECFGLSSYHTWKVQINVDWDFAFDLRRTIELSARKRYACCKGNDCSVKQEVRSNSNGECQRRFAQQRDRRWKYYEFSCVAFAYENCLRPVRER